MRQTLLDMQKRLGSDGSLLLVAELLNKSTPILEDSIWIPTNKTDSKQVGQTVRLPTIGYRRANRGAAVGKSVVAQIEEATCSFEDFAENDVKVIDSYGDQKAEARAQESARHIEAVGQRFARELFYGSRVSNPDGIEGFARRYRSVATGNARQNTLDFGGTGNDNTSIFVVKWSPSKVACIYPKRDMGKPQGAVEHEDMGTQMIQTTEGTTLRRMKAYVDRFSISGGLCVGDWRAAVRICNIDVSDLASAAVAGNSRLRQFLVRALHRLPMGDGMTKIYMNRTVAQYLDIERLGAVEGGGMTYPEVDGMVVPHFRGFPIRVEDTIVLNEARVV